MELWQLQLGRDRAPECATAGLRAECPQPVGRVVNERHPQSISGGGEIDDRGIKRAERHAALASAKSLGLCEPPGGPLELLERNATAREDHSALR